MVELGESVRERADLLENTQWAEDLTWKEIESFAKYLNIKRISRGATVFREGAREAYMCIIVQGSVQVIKESTTHEKKVLSLIGKGKTFGEMVIFDGEPRSATIVSADTTTLLILTRENLDRLMKDVPSLAAKFLFKIGKMISQRLRLTSGQLVDFID